LIDHFPATAAANSLSGKVTIRPGFSWTVPIFNDVSREKFTALPGRPFVPFLAWCPGFVPDIDKLRYFTVRILILTCRSLYNAHTKKNRWRPGLRPGPRWGSSQRSPNPQVGSQTACECGARTLQRSSRNAVPKLWSSYSVFTAQREELTPTVILAHFIGRQCFDAVGSESEEFPACKN